MPALWARIPAYQQSAASHAPILPSCWLPEAISTVPTNAVPTDAMVRVDKAGPPANAIPVITGLADSIAAGLGTAGQDDPYRQDRRGGGKQSKPAHAFLLEARVRVKPYHHFPGGACEPCLDQRRPASAIPHDGWPAAKPRDRCGKSGRPLNRFAPGGHRGICR
jgi:hypothetical protein